MENKYYTPTIEEFHVGFEHEIATVDSDWNITSWGKSIFDNGSLISNIRDYPDLYRVKYLDKEDIESLGFGGYIAPHEYDHTWYHTSNIILKVWFNQEQPIIRIMSVPNTIIFHGTIKNKSELKVLLKQLGIE